MIWEVSCIVYMCMVLSWAPPTKIEPCFQDGGPSPDGALREPAGLRGSFGWSTAALVEDFGCTARVSGNCQGERVVSWDFWVWKWSTPQKLMDLMVWSSSSLFKMAFWLGLWAFFCLSERRSPVKLAIWWYNLCCFPQFSSSFPVFPPFYPCFPPVSPHFPWHFPWWFPCASPSEDLRLAEASLEELLRHRRHTAFYKAGAELPKPH